MTLRDQLGGRPLPADARDRSDPYIKENIGVQLDAFAEEYGIKSLRDRLRIGLNEVGMLAFDQTNGRIKKMVEQMTGSPEEAEEVYRGLVQMCVEIQQRGPWGFVEEFKNPESPVTKAWFMMAGAETIGYERGMDLNDKEFRENIERIKKLLDEGIEDPEAFFQKAYGHNMKRSEEKIRFRDDDPEHRVPFGDEFAAVLPMAMQGYDAGVLQDAEGWVYVASAKNIDDGLIESIGLKKEVGPDDRDPSRTVTWFKNPDGTKAIKKLFGGLLIVVTRNFDLAGSIVKALNDDKDSIEVAEEALGHTRVIQTSEKERTEAIDIAKKNIKKKFLKPSIDAVASNEMSESTAISRPREDFYDNMLYIRGMYVYLDALEALEEKRKEQGKEVTDRDKEILSRKIWEKMQQKVDELRFINGILDEEFATMPDDIRSVVDMAGGAGDLGLAITNEMLSRGREVDRTEIVDPQAGVAQFMNTIIGNLPFRQRLEEIAVHNTGYLQDADISPDSIVVAKHACGTLTDAIIEQWRDSESKMMVAMTCCQEKAHDKSARYGFSQDEWSRLCKESSMTNTEIPDEPGKKQDRAKQRLEKGRMAMMKLDGARVEYLRRHGFKAELRVTDKFPKGDVIVARRLPENFMSHLDVLQKMERDEPLKFDAQMMRLDLLAAGREPSKEELELFGKDWVEDDYAELTRRFIAHAYEERIPVEASAEKESAADAGQEKQEAKKLQRIIMRQVFPDSKGRIDLYLTNRAKAAGKEIDPRSLDPIIQAIRSRMYRNESEKPKDIREAVDVMMNEMEI